jgi:hypothetical protein
MVYEYCVSQCFCSCTDFYSDVHFMDCILVTCAVMANVCGMRTMGVKLGLLH